MRTGGAMYLRTSPFEAGSLLRGDDTQPSFAFTLPCDSCGRRLNLFVSKETPPDQLSKKAKAKGWQSDKRHKRPSLCPACLAQPKVKEDVMAKVDQVDVGGVAPGGTVAMNPKLMRAVYGALDEVFDEGRGRYREGDDAWVAKNTGASVEFVRRVRREAYGEIKSTAELDKLRAELLVLEGELTALTARIMEGLAKMETRVVDLAARFEEALGDLE